MRIHLTSSRISIAGWFSCLSLVVCLLIPMPSVQAAGRHRIPVLDSIERSIDEGRMEAARHGLAQCRGMSLPSEAEAWREVLQARFMSLDGRQHEAYESLQRLTASLRSAPRMTEVLAEAYLACADICRAMQWIHRLNEWNESVGAICRTNPMPGHIHMRYATNRVYFFSVGLLVEKVGPDMRAMDSLLARSTANDRHLYRPILALAVQTGLNRNKDRTLTRLMSDSLYGLVGSPVPRGDSEGWVLLWKTVGNFYMDFVAKPQVDAREARCYSTVVDRCFEKAMGLLAERFPRHVGEMALVMNLKGLNHYFIREHGKAVSLLRSSRKMLGESGLTPSSHTMVYGQNASYMQRCIDSIYRGGELRRLRLGELRQWQEIARAWDRWEDMNRDSLGHYRYFYLADPGLYQVYLCHALYRETRETALLQTAFEAQEQSKYRELKRRYRLRSGKPEPLLPSIDSLRRSLARDEAIVSISDAFSIPASTYFITVTPDTVLFSMLDVSPRLIMSTGVTDGIEHFGRDAKSFRDVYHTLWKLVFRDLEPYLQKARRIRLFTSPFTSAFSFDLLIPDTVGARTFGSLRYLRDRYRFTYDYSWTVARMRAEASKEESRARPNLAYMPDYRVGSFYRLPFFEGLGDTLADRFGFRVRMRGKATREDFLRHAPDAGIVHIGAHGFSNVIAPSDLFIVMDSAQSGYSHRLTPLDLVDTELKAELAVLSVCQGGVSRYDHQGLRHMAYWFNYAGAHSCLYSFWKIDDRSTAWILGRFYGYLSKGVGRYDALRQAQDDYLRNAKNDEERTPLYWGGLTIIGEDGPLSLIEREEGIPWVWLSFGLSLTAISLALALYARRRRMASIPSRES